MKKSISLVVGSLLTTLLHAQDSTNLFSLSRHLQVDVGIGYLHTKMNSINTSLKSAGFNPMKEHYATFSLGATTYFNRFMFRAEGSMILPNSVDQPNNVNTEFTGYTMGVNVGYAVVETKRFRLTPYVGINSFTTHLKFNDRTPVTTMNEVLTTPRNNARITFSNGAIDLGAQLERLMPFKNNQWNCPQNNRYMTFALRLGYHLSPGTIKGRYNGTQITGAPEYNYQGPYMKLLIGWGTKIRQLNWR